MNAQAHIDGEVAGKSTETVGPVDGKQIEIGAGFKALGFRHGDFAGLMDPLIMVDHFTMSESTFGAHGHAGISAVSILLEDSKGVFNNRDSLGNNIDLMPGDLYWLKAGSGALHDEKPQRGGRTHGLQMFVNLPAAAKYDAPQSLHVKAAEIPVVEAGNYRVRILLGESNGVKGAAAPALPITILDAHLSSGSYSHRVGAGNDAWIHAVDGDADIVVEERSLRLAAGQSLALRAGDQDVTLTFQSKGDAQVVAVVAAPLRESFVQRGPIAMSTREETDRVTAAYERGEFGSIA